VLVTNGSGEGGEDEAITFSQHLACTYCGISFEEPAPRSFSFNSPYGACPVCLGLGTKFEVDPDLVVPDDSLSLAEGALAPWAGARSEYFTGLQAGVAEFGGFDFDAPWKSLKAKDKKLVLYGTGSRTIRVTYKNRFNRTRSYDAHFEGIIPWLQRRHGESESDWSREQIEMYMREVDCPACNGARLKPESLAVIVGGRNIYELCSLSIGAAVTAMADLELTEREHMIADRVFKEIRERMQFLLDVGLDYLSLARASSTLSGGEAQRIRLASQIGSGPSACTSATTSASSRRSSACGIWATLSSSSSTTRRPSARPTTSSTSGLVPASTAA
jgi:excinuclease ABC subunit A